MLSHTQIAAAVAQGARVPQAGYRDLPRNYDLEAALRIQDQIEARAGLHVAASSATDAAQPVVPLDTRIELGTPQLRRWFGDLVMPNFPRTTWKVQVPSLGTEHLKIHDTERGWSVERARTDFALATVEYEMESHGLESPVDRRMLSIADNRWRLPVRAASIARRGVLLNAEWRKALLLGDTTTYAASHTSDLTGSEWDAAGGDVDASIQTAIAQLQSANPGVQPEDMRLALSSGGWAAAKNDPTWAAVRANFTDSKPTMANLASYLGIGGVDMADCNVEISGTVQSLWGDIGILYLPVSPAALDPEWGESTFALNHTLGLGQVYGPYWEPRTTTDWHPFDLMSLPVVHSNDAAYLMYNVKE